MKRMMKRGVSQSLYKYLPESWIDFTVRGEERANYIAQVERWNSEKLVDINKARLLRVINQSIRSFENVSGREASIESVTGYGSGLTVDNCDVLTPKHDCDERGIVARIDPLAFFCPECHRVYQFKDPEQYRYNKKCRTCTAELKQMRQIYYCKCGYATGRHSIYCSTCKSYENLTWSGRYNDFEFRCNGCKRKIQMVKKCEMCGKTLRPKAALDSSQYFPFSVSIIDIIDEKVESFISNTEYGSLLTISHWLGDIPRNDLIKLIDKGGVTEDPEEYQRDYEEKYKMFIDAGLDEISAETAARASAGNSSGSEYISIADKLRASIYTTPEALQKASEAILEYTFVNEIKDSSTLDDAETISQTLNTNANPEAFKIAAQKRSVSMAKVCGDIPFVCCSYGYTREKPEPGDGVVLHAFKEEQHGKKNVYATKMQTEGVLFEIDRKQILRWLIENKYIDKNAIKDLNDEREVKLWFINNVHADSIRPFSEIDIMDKGTFYVYNLIHTLSHLLIKSAASMCGLDKNSLSEYILPNIPALLIYCQNSQGFNLGALFNLFEAYFDKWLEKAFVDAQKCIFDPICIDRYRACTGCLFLNEISCQHFNHDLDRALIIGNIDKQKDTRSFGFWENKKDG